MNQLNCPWCDQPLYGLVKNVRGIFYHAMCYHELETESSPISRYEKIEPQFSIKPVRLFIEGRYVEGVSVHDKKRYEHYLACMRCGLITDNGFLEYVLAN